MYQAVVLGALAGQWDASPGGPLGYAASSPFDLPFDEAVAWFRARDVVTLDEFAELSESAAERAFRVAGVTDRRVLDAVHSSLDRAIEGGGTLSEWAENLDNRLDVLDAEPFGLHHMDLIFQNAVGDAYAGGRYTQMKRTADARPFWKYSTAGDGRVRPAHQSMEGVIARHDDPLWEVWYPPNGHRCRCEVTSLTAEEAGPDAFEPPPNVTPDRGWSRSPARAGAADRATRQLRQEARQLDLPLTGLASPAGKVGRLRRRDLDVLHASAMQALDRQADPIRHRAIRQSLGLTDEELRDLLADQAAVRFIPGGLRIPSEGSAVELALPAQNRLALEELVRRLAFAGHEVIASTRTRLHLRRTDGPALPHEVPEPALQGFGVPARWTSEAVLRIDEASPEVVELLLAQAQTRGGGPAIPFAPERADLMVLGTAELTGITARRIFLRQGDQGMTAAVEAVPILPGWEPVTVGVPRWEP